MTFDKNASTFRKSMDSDAQYNTYCRILQFILKIILALTQSNTQYVGKLFLFNR